MRATAILLLTSLMALAAPVPKEPPPDPLGKGYMGVYAGSEGSSLVISRIEPNTPASRAGLRGGDTFLRVGPLKPQNFDQVRDLIGSLRPGTKIDIVVKRGESETTTVLTLTNRPPTFGMGTLTDPEP